MDLEFLEVQLQLEQSFTIKINEEFYLSSFMEWLKCKLFQNSNTRCKIAVWMQGWCS